MKLEEWLHTLPLRLRGLFRPDEINQELKEELRDHLDRLIDENVGKGMSPEEGAICRAAGDGRDGAGRTTMP